MTCTKVRRHLYLSFAEIELGVFVIIFKNEVSTFKGLFKMKDTHIGQHGVMKRAHDH